MTTTETRTAATEAWLERDADALAGVLPRYYDVVAERGEGAWLVDVDGRRFLDFGAGIAVNATGHCHPAVVAAVADQAARLLHTSVVVHHQRNVELAERLRAAVAAYLPDAQVFFCNSGAEAVDGAIKLARHVTGRPGIVSFRGAFHGRTLAATTLTTAKAKYREGYEPLLPSVHVAPWCVDGDWQSALAGFDEVLRLQAPPSTVAAVVVEPVLGEGGYVVPPAEWLAGLRARCDEHGMLLVFDEVQTGAGRTGALFAAERLGVAPDVLLFAKGIASGLPLGGIIASEAVMSRWPTGSHGSTFGGNPVSCAAAVATLDVIASEGLCGRAALLGERALERLRAVATRSPVVRDVRGLGLMIGVELATKDDAVAVAHRCLADGLIVLTCGPGENVLRLAPPLTLTDSELDLGLDILCAALAGDAHDA